MKDYINEIERSFSVSAGMMRRIIEDFHQEMGRGLAGKRSSLKMIPAYVDRPTGKEKGEFIALDLGGTNFRVLELELKGRGRMSRPKSKKFVIDKKHMKGPGERLFRFIADCIGIFMKENGLDRDRVVRLGFTFSFPVEQQGLVSGRLLRWTKGFSASGVVGKDVVKLLEDALAKEGMANIRVAALANDTVGTLVSLGYSVKDCDMGVIIGTGTNACYLEKISNIKKWRMGTGNKGPMIINTEWGNFNKLPLTRYDKEVDTGSGNPGQQILEKMVSGMFLGELARLVLKDLKARRLIFSGTGADILNKKYSFKTEYMSAIESDSSAGMRKTLRVLKNIGISKSTTEDRYLVKKICYLISNRGAFISGAAIGAVITKMDPGITQGHTVAIDGAVYEKHPGFSMNIRKALKELFGARASRIKIRLAKDGSGKGAAIIAAVAKD